MATAAKKQDLFGLTNAPDPYANRHPLTQWQDAQKREEPDAYPFTLMGNDEGNAVRAGKDAAPQVGSRENPWADEVGAPAQPNAPGVQSFGDWLKAKDAAKEASIPGGTDSTPDWMTQALQENPAKPQNYEAMSVQPVAEPQRGWYTTDANSAAPTEEEPGFWGKVRQSFANVKQNRKDQQKQQQPSGFKSMAFKPLGFNAPQSGPSKPVKYKPSPDAGGVIVTMSDGTQHTLPMSDPSVVRMMANTPREQ